MHPNHLPLLLSLLISLSLAAQKPIPAWMETRLALAGRYTTFEIFNDRLAIAHNGQHSTLIDRAGRELASLPASSFWKTPAGHGLTVWNERGAGFVSATGRVVLPLEYDQVHAHWPSRLIAAQKGDRWKLFDEHGRPLSLRQPLYGVAQLWADTVVGMNARGFFGVWTADGRSVLPDTFHYLQRRPNGYWKAWRLGQVALLAPDGRPLTPYLFNDIVRLPDGRLLARFERESPYFFVDAGGRVIDGQPVSFNAAGHGAWFYTRGDSAVLVDARGRRLHLRDAPRDVEYGRLLLGGRVLSLSTPEGEGGEVISLCRPSDGRLLNTPFYSLVELQNHLVAADHGNTMLIDDRLNVVRHVPFRVELDSARRWWPYGTHRYEEESDGGMRFTYGLVDSQLNVVVPPRYDRLFSLGEGYYAGGDHTMLGLYAPDGRLLWPHIFAVDPGQDLAAQVYRFQSEGRTGLINLRGEVVAPARYESIEALAANRFLIAENGRWGMTDDRGQSVLPPVYESISALSPGLLQLQRNGRYGLATASGVPITPLDFDAVERNYPYVLVVQRQGRYGVYDRHGKQILPVEYERPVRHGNQYILHRAGRYGVYDIRFDAIAPTEQDTAWATPGKLHWRKGGVGHVWPPDTGTARLVHTSSGYYGWSTGEEQFHPFTLALDDRCGVYSPTKVEIWPPVYRQIVPVRRGAVSAAVRRDGRGQLLGSDRRVLYEFEADKLLQSRFGYVSYSKAGQTFLLDTENHASIPLNGPAEHTAWTRYDDIDVLAVTADRSTRFYDRALKPLSPGSWPQTERCAGWPFFRVFDENGSVGLLERTASGMAQVLPCAYEVRESGSYFFERWFWLERDGKFGAFDLRTGKLLPAVYDQIGPIANGSLVEATLDGKVQLFGPGFVPLGEGPYEQWQSIGDTLFIAGREGRVGVLEAGGRWVVPMEYDGIDFSGSDYPGYFFALRRGDRFGGYRPGERSVLPAQFDQVSFSNPNFLVNIGEKQGLYTAAGREALAPEAWRISPPQYGRGYFVVERDGQTGLVDRTGRFVIPPEYDAVHAVDGAAVVQRNDRYGLFGFDDGRMVLPVEYDVLEADAEGHPFFLARRGGLLQYVDARGRPIATPAIDVHSPFVGGLAAVRVGGRWGYLDTLGRLAIAPRFDYAENFAYNGRAVVLADGRYQFIDRYGALVRDYHTGGRFVEVHFQRRLHTVRDEAAGVYRLRNAYGEEIFNSWHALEATPNNGLIACWTPLDDGEKAGPVGMLDLAGQAVVKPVYDDLSTEGFRTSHYTVVRRNGKAGFIDRRGQVVIPLRYDSASPFCETGDCEEEGMMAHVVLNGKMFGINLRGECVWNCE